MFTHNLLHREMAVAIQQNNERKIAAAELRRQARAAHRGEMSAAGAGEVGVPSLPRLDLSPAAGDRSSAGSRLPRRATHRRDTNDPPDA